MVSSQAQDAHEVLLVSSFMLKGGATQVPLTCGPCPKGARGATAPFPGTSGRRNSSLLSALLVLRPERFELFAASLPEWCLALPPRPAWQGGRCKGPTQSRRD